MLRHCQLDLLKASLRRELRLLTSRFFSHMGWTRINSMIYSMTNFNDFTKHSKDFTNGGMGRIVQISQYQNLIIVLETVTDQHHGHLKAVILKPLGW